MRLILAVAALIVWSGIAAASTEALNNAADPYQGSVGLTQDKGRTVIRISGVITEGLSKSFIQTLAGVPAGTPMVVELNSPGGFTKAGYAMIDAMVAKRRSDTPIATYVRDTGVCESMCVGVFMAGYPRLAEPGASFMVHAPRIEKTGMTTLRSTHEMITRLVSLGASRTWIDQVRKAGGFSGTVDYRENAVMLSRDGSNVVTTLVSGP